MSTSFIPIRADGYYTREPIQQTVYAPLYVHDSLLGQKRSLWTRPYKTVAMDIGNFNPHSPTKALRPWVNYVRPIKWEGQVWDPYTATLGSGPTKPRAISHAQAGVSAYYPPQCCSKPGPSCRQVGPCCATTGYCCYPKAWSWRREGPPTTNIINSSCQSCPMTSGSEPISKQQQKAAELMRCDARRGCYRTVRANEPAPMTPGDAHELQRNTTISFHQTVAKQRQDAPTRRRFEQWGAVPPKRKAHHF